MLRPIGQAEVGDCPPPDQSAAKEVRVRFPAEQAPAEEILRSVGDFRRPTIRTGRVQAAEPDGPAVAQRNIEALIDADRLDPPTWAAASGKGKGSPIAMTASAAQATQSRGARESRAQARRRCAERKFMLRALPRGGRPCPERFGGCGVDWESR